ncbi:MAG: LLM class flavin-dependent oxidoreductase, partial [Chloroflexi bacterium]|nr:LLM class flavin-dependent oxidoreductase [Chloroflexota bacterium]
MKIGLYIRLLGRPGTEPPPPSWLSVRDQALAAEAAGFDLVVFEDALLYPDGDESLGVWESVSMVAAIAAATSTIGVGHAVMNSPYRQPAVTAKIAATLD